MATAQTTTIDEKDALFDVYLQEQALEELLLIIAEALQSQDLAGLQASIAYWENQYPIEKFDNNYKAKIKRYLSDDYLVWISQYIEQLADIARKCKVFDPVKAKERLDKIISIKKGAGDYNGLLKEITAWQIAYPIDKFSEYYQKIIIKKTNEKYLKEVAQLFSERDAIDELEKIISSTDNISELKCKIIDWKAKFPEKGFSDKNKSKITSIEEDATIHTSKNAVEELNSLVTDFKADIEAGKKQPTDLFQAVSTWQNRNKFEDIAEQFYPIIKELTNNGYLLDSSSMSIEEKLQLVKHNGPLNQEKAYLELVNALTAGNYSSKVLDWVYKYSDYIKYFDDEHIGLILEKTNTQFRIPKSGIKTVSRIDIPECKDLDSVKKMVTIQFLSHLFNKTALLDIEKENLRNIYAGAVIAENAKERCEKSEAEIQEAIKVIDKSIYNPSSEKGMPKEAKTITPKADFPVAITYTPPIIEEPVINEQTLESNVAPITDDKSNNPKNEIPVIEEAESKTDKKIDILAKTFTIIVEDKMPVVENVQNNKEETGSETITSTIVEDKVKNTQNTIPFIEKEQPEDTKVTPVIIEENKPNKQIPELTISNDLFNEGVTIYSPPKEATTHQTTIEESVVPEQPNLSPVGFSTSSTIIVSPFLMDLLTSRANNNRTKGTQEVKLREGGQ